MQCLVSWEMVIMMEGWTSWSARKFTSNRHWCLLIKWRRTLSYPLQITARSCWNRAAYICKLVLAMSSLDHLLRWRSLSCTSKDRASDRWRKINHFWLCLVNVVVCYILLWYHALGCLHTFINLPSDYLGSSTFSNHFLTLLVKLHLSLVCLRI